MIRTLLITTGLLVHHCKNDDFIHSYSLIYSADLLTTGDWNSPIPTLDSVCFCATFDLISFFYAQCFVSPIFSSPGGNRVAISIVSDGLHSVCLPCTPSYNTLIFFLVIVLLLSPWKKYNARVFACIVLFAFVAHICLKCPWASENIWFLRTLSLHNQQQMPMWVIPALTPLL